MISLLAGISDVKNAHISNQNLPNSFRDLGNLNSLEKISMKYNSKILPGNWPKTIYGFRFYGLKLDFTIDKRLNRKAKILYHAGLPPQKSTCSIYKTIFSCGMKFA